MKIKNPNQSPLNPPAVLINSVASPSLVLPARGVLNGRDVSVVSETASIMDSIVAENEQFTSSIEERLSIIRRQMLPQIEKISSFKRE